MLQHGSDALAVGKEEGKSIDMKMKMSGIEI